MCAAKGIDFSLKGFKFEPCAFLVNPTGVAVGATGINIAPQGISVAPTGVNVNPFGLSISPSLIVIAPFDTTVAGQVGAKTLNLTTTGPHNQLSIVYLPNFTCANLGVSMQVACTTTVCSPFLPKMLVAAG